MLIILVLNEDKYSLRLMPFPNKSARLQEKKIFSTAHRICLIQNLYYL